MRLAILLRYRRSLLMPLDAGRRFSPLATPRPFSAQAQAPKDSSAPKRSSNSPPPGERPIKMSKVESSGPSSAGPSAMSRYKGGRGSLLAKAQKNNASKSSGSSKGGGGKRRGKGPSSLPGPLHDEAYITKTYRTKDLKKIYESNPKSPLNNYVMASGAQPLAFTTVQGIVEGGDQQVFRFVPCFHAWL